MIFENYQVWHDKFSKLEEILPHVEKELTFAIIPKTEKLEVKIKLYIPEPKATDVEKLVQYVDAEKLMIAKHHRTNGHFRYYELAEKT